MNIRTDIESLKTESMYKPVRFFAITFLEQANTRPPLTAETAYA